MSDLIKTTQSYVATRPEGEIGKAVGASLFKLGLGGTGAIFVAGLLPFIGIQMLFIMMVLGGGALYLAKS
jgi:hypothetical protein